MAIFTFVLGSILLGLGGYGIYMGFDIVDTDRGLAMTLCGTITFLFGILIAILGFALVYLGRIRAVLVDIAEGLPAPAMESVTAPARPKIGTREIAGGAVIGAGAIAAGAALSTQLNTGYKDQDPDLKDMVLDTPSSPSKGQIQADNSGDDLDRLIEELTLDSKAVLPKIIPVQNDAVQDHNHDFQDHDMFDFDKSEVTPEVKAASDTPAPVENAAILNTDHGSGVFEAELRNELDSHVKDVHLQADIAAKHEKDQMDADVPDSGILHGAEEETDIIGSYESAGVTYTLIADGSVIAKANNITEKYGSLEALKAAFESGKSAFSI